jgi:undecaprenyl-diphosphatase
MSIFETLLFAFIEGVTEFLPISSTGHMVIASHFLGSTEAGFAKAFMVIIQLGAILSVVWLYREKFFSTSVRFYTRLVAACIPAGVLGLLFEKRIDQALGSIHVVIASLLIGGLVLLWIERRAKPSTSAKLDQLSIPQAVKVGAFQAIALIPGVSRSGATIVGAMLSGFSRQDAAEFSFLVSVPIMLGAASLKAYKSREFLTGDNLISLAIGFIAAFVVALVVVKFLIQYLQKHSLAAFGWYRIGLSLLLLLLVGI